MALADLITRLSEIYQPIFGHPELTCHPSRTCDDRLHHIIPVHNALQDLLGRPLRVLDLGCAQGYISFGLAVQGAVVHGVDILEENITLCKAIAQENPKLSVTFESGSLEDVLFRLKEDQFDLVLGLSVFHHIVYRMGIEFVRQLLQELSGKVGVCIFEFALSKEPVYWASTQPKDPRDLLIGFAFIHEIASHVIHLSEIMRPMYFASSFFWFIDDCVGHILSWKSSPHTLADNANHDRRYYFGNGKFIKIYKIEKDVAQTNRDRFNLEEIEREAEFLRHPPQGFPVPKLIVAGSNDHEAWLIRELIPGELLLDLIQRNQAYNPTQVLDDILDQCTKLEEAGYYHNDIRTWNVLILPDGHAILMDHGAIIKNPIDCVWPNNIFLSFLIFSYEVIAGDELSPMPLRIPAMSPGWFEPPYYGFIEAFLSQPVNMWSFKSIKKLFHKFVIQSGKDFSQKMHLSYFSVWQQAIENAIFINTNNTRNILIRLDGLDADKKLLIAKMRIEHENSLRQIIIERENSQRLEQELRSVYSSNSMRITAPLRVISNIAIKAIVSMKRLFQDIWNSILARSYPLHKTVIRFAEAHPSTKSWALAIIHRYPSVEAWLRRFTAYWETTHRGLAGKLLEVSIVSGFYSPEFWSGVQTRWMQSEAILRVITPEKCIANLSLKAFAFYRPRTIEVHAGGELAGRVEVNTAGFIDVSLPVMLAVGENIILLKVPEGCERACDKPDLNNLDSRCLSVAIQNVTVK